MMGQSNSFSFKINLDDYRRSSSSITKKEDQLNLYERRHCPECDSVNIVESGGVFICSDCGVDLGSVVDTGVDWRCFDVTDQKKIHAEPTRIDKGLSTRMNTNGKDAYGQSLSSFQRYNLNRLSKVDFINKRTREEEVMQKVNNLLGVVSGNLSLPRKIVQEILFTIKKKINGRSLKGKSIDDLTLAVLAKICKINGRPYTLDEISRASRQDHGRIKNVYMKLNLNNNKMTDPTEYIPRFASKLEVSTMTEVEAMKILNNFKEHHDYKKVSMGKNPIGYSAGALYIACIIHGERPIRDKKIVSGKTGITPSALKLRAKELIDLLDIDLEMYYEMNYGDIDKPKYKNRAEALHNKKKKNKEDQN